MAFISAARLALCASALALAAAAVDSCAAKDTDCEVAALSSVELLQSASSWVQVAAKSSLELLQSTGSWMQGQRETVWGRAAIENWGVATQESLRTCVSKYADSLDTVKKGLGTHIRRHHLRPANISHRALIINAGSGTTATRSLTAALSILNLTGIHWAPRHPWEKFILDTLGMLNCDKNCRPTEQSSAQKINCHKRLQAFDFSSIPTGVDYLTDTPIAEVFLDLYLAFPRAKWLLTTRDSLEWATMRRRLHTTSSFAPVQEPCGEFITSYNISDLARLQEMQDDLVRCVVPRRRLLEFSVFTDPPQRIDNLMAELSEFAGRPLQQTLKFPNVG